MTPWLIAGGLILGLPLLAACIWIWRTRDNATEGRHAAPHSFPPPRIPARRRAAIHWQQHRERSLNLRIRLAARQRTGDTIRDCWHTRYAPPMTPLPRPELPAYFYTDLPGPAGARVTTASESSGAVMPAAAGDGLLYPLEMARAAVGRAGEPTPNQRALLWQARQVMPEHVIRALTRQGGEDTVVTPRDLEYLVGGDVYDGLGQEEWLNRMFPPPKAITWSAA